MPKLCRPIKDRNSLLRGLQRIYDGLNEKHNQSAPRDGAIPVGGGDWMDSFFRMEAVRGAMGALRLGKTLDYSTQVGKDTSSVAVRIWNSRREYEVHRWEQTAWNFLENTISRLSKELD